MPINPLIKATSGPESPHGDEVQIPLMRNPYQGDPQNQAEFENGYEFAQSMGHAQLNQVGQEEIDRWKNQSLAWRAGFATATSRFGLENIAKMVMGNEAEKQAKARITQRVGLQIGRAIRRRLNPAKTDKEHLDEAARTVAEDYYMDPDKFKEPKTEKKAMLWATEYFKTAMNVGGLSGFGGTAAAGTPAQVATPMVSQKRTNKFGPPVPDGGAPIGRDKMSSLMLPGAEKIAGPWPAAIGHGLTSAIGGGPVGPLAGVPLSYAYNAGIKDMARHMGVSPEEAEAAHGGFLGGAGRGLLTALGTTAGSIGGAFIAPHVGMDPTAGAVIGGAATGLPTSYMLGRGAALSNIRELRGAQATQGI